MTVKQPRGLPYNMPAHSLQRSQYVNGLAELTPEIRRLGATEENKVGCQKVARQTNAWEVEFIFGVEL